MEWVFPRTNSSSKQVQKKRQDFTSCLFALQEPAEQLLATYCTRSTISVPLSSFTFLSSDAMTDPWVAFPAESDSPLMPTTPRLLPFRRAPAPALVDAVPATVPAVFPAVFATPPAVDPICPTVPGLLPEPMRPEPPDGYPTPTLFEEGIPEPVMSLPPAIAADACGGAMACIATEPKGTWVPSFRTA